MNENLLKEKESIIRDNKDYYNYLNDIENYTDYKYEHCRNMGKHKKQDKIRNITFEQYKKNNPNTTNTKGVFPGGAAPVGNNEYEGKKINNSNNVSSVEHVEKNIEKQAYNKTASNNSKQNNDDFVDYSYDPFLEAFMSDDKYERRKLVKNAVKQIEEASVDELEFLEGFYDDDNVDPEIKTALKERRNKIAKNTDPDGGYWFTTKNGKHIHVNGELA